MLGPMDELTLDLAPPEAGEPGVRLSYSSLSTYETCGLQYKFRYVDRIPTPPSPILAFGNALHEALRRWYNQPVPVAPPPAELLAHLDEVWDPTAFRTESQEHSFKAHGRQVLTEFHAANAPSFRIPVALEQRFEIDVEGVTVSGAIDRMDRHPDGTYELIDYKTNRRLPPLAKVEQDLQLSIYYMAAWEIWGIRPDKLTLYFLLPGQPMSSVRTPADAAAVRERILRVAEQVAAARFEPREGPLCNWCDYQPRCPLFEHMFRREDEPAPDVQKTIDEWIARKRRSLADWRRLDELADSIHAYADREGLQRLFGEGGAITRYEVEGAAFDPAIVRAALPADLLNEVLRVDDAAVSALLARDDLPDQVRARLEEARIDRTTWALRLKEDRKPR